MSDVSTETVGNVNQEKKMGYIICRVCGYIETADNADKPCPACGFPKTVWMEYKPRKLNPTRAKLLDLHLHPIAVHFPIVGGILTFALPVLGLLVPYLLAERLFDFAALTAIVMPLLALIGAISGAVGGQLRYKTVKAPILKKKIIMSCILFVLTIIQSYIAFTQGVHADNALLIIALGAVESLLCAILGKMGSYLFASRFGPFVQG